MENLSLLLKKALFLLVFLATLSFASKANPVDLNRARTIGAKFVSANTTMKSATANDLQLITTYRTSSDVAAFYVFNLDNGFVIVSADDCATPILAYSDRGTFDMENIPVQMQSYLDVYVKEIEYGIEHRVNDESSAKQWDMVQKHGMKYGVKGDRVVTPLLGNTIWNQSCYYNNLCPSDSQGPCEHVYAGCVATAMGQVMHYWSYPEHGSGSHTYTPDGYSTQTANFGATTYDWTNMPDYINAYSPANQINAIATLLWHCGISVNMMYGYDGSGAYSSDVPYALKNYFIYSDDLYGQYRSNYTYDNWVSMLKANLDLGYPLYYSGSDINGGGGHAFVCDGYDANDMFWFNWGWSGNQNAYCAIDALIAGSYQFNNYQYAIFNIHPNTNVNFYNITATANPSSYGTVSGDGYFLSGRTCTLTAIPNDGYVFKNWTKNGNIVSTQATYEFQVTENASYVAHFEVFEGITIGSGTETFEKLPGYSYYNYSFTEQIYTAAEIGTSVQFTSLAFYNGGATKTRALDVYMIHTTKSSFTSNTDWIPVSSANLVYSGSVTMTADTWTTLNLDTPFMYNGTSNLAIVVDDNTGSWTDPPHMSCRVFATGSNQALWIFSDETNYNPSSPSSYSGNLNAAKNQIRLGIEGGNFISITVSANPTAGGYVSGGGSYLEGATATITAAAATGYTFVNWTKNGVEVATTPAYSFTVTEEAEYVANFEALPAEYMIVEPFDEYTVGNKIATSALAAGHEWWTTWSNTPGSSEDGTVASFNNHICAHFIYGNDQVLLLNNQTAGLITASFDMYIPNGKDAYNNMIHIFNGQGSEWCTEVYYKHSTNGTSIQAGGNSTSFSCPYDQWFNVKYVVDLDNDVVTFYVDNNAIKTWQFSLQANGNSGTRQLAALNFFPPTSASTSEYYVDNIVVTKTNGNSAPAISVNPTSVQTTLGNDDFTSVNITIANSGTSIGEWSGYIDYGQGGAGTQTASLAYHDGAEGSNIGNASEYVREMGARFPASMYGETAMGMRAVSANYYINSQYHSANNYYTFRLYEEGINGQPGMLLSEKTLYSTALGTWITATFDDAVYLTGKTIWVTVELLQGAGEYPMTMDYGSYGENSNGNWLSTNGGTFSHCYSSGSFEGAWIITLDCQGTPIPGTWASIDKTSGSLTAGNSDVVILSINSIGLENDTYEATFVINTNDENNPSIEIPVLLEVDGFNEYLIGTGVSPSTGGMTYGAGEYYEGTLCTLYAYPEEHYEFVNWTKNGVVVSTNDTYSFYVTENATYVAHFNITDENIYAVSTYDLQSNSMLGNRIALWDDGTAAFVTMMDVTGYSPYNGRGTAYNYYNGTSLSDVPTERVESEKSGWPSIAPLGNGEILASHTSSGVNIYKRATKGQGDWNLAHTFYGWAWPRIATTGNGQYVHTVFGEVDGSNVNYVKYSRSTNAGVTWSDPVDPPLVDNAGMYKNNIGADDYVIATNGDKVAILFATKETDVFYIYSDDNGATWSKQIVAQFPYEHALDWNDPQFTIDTDTIWTCDNSGSIAIDNDGVVHVAFGLTRYAPTGANYYTYFYVSNGIVYWNSNYVNEQGGHEIPMYGSWSGDVNHPEWSYNGSFGLSNTLNPDRVEELAAANGRNNLNIIIPDENHDGYIDNTYILNRWGSYRTMGNSTMPSVSIDENGNMILAYSALSESRICSTTNYYYRNCMVTARDNQGNWFYDAYNFNVGAGHEDDEVYYVTTNSQGKNCNFWVAYGVDNTQGLYLDNNNQSYLTNNYYYAVQINPSELEGWGGTVSNTHVITAIANPAVGGVVTGGGTYYEGTTCTLTATANTGYNFVNWTRNGTIVSTNASYSFTVNENANYVANFVPMSYAITATANPAAGGTVVGGGTYNYGVQCTLIAVPNNGYNFVNWKLGNTIVSTSSAYIFTVTEAGDYVATFEEIIPETYTIIVMAVPETLGIVTGGGTYEEGEQCTVAAVPTDNAHFVNWTENGAVVSTNAVYSFTVTANRILLANFEEDLPETYDIVLVADPADLGAVTGGGTFEAGQQCVVAAAPLGDAYFINWTENGEVVSEDVVYTFTVTENRTLVAHFGVDGVDEISEMNVVLYPNPASDKVMIETSEFISRCEVYNINGALVYSMNECSNNFEINVSEFAAGSYIVRLISDKSVQTRRFTKK